MSTPVTTYLSTLLNRFGYLFSNVSTINVESSERSPRRENWSYVCVVRNFHQGQVTKVRQWVFLELVESVNNSWIPHVQLTRLRMLLGF